MRAWRILCLVGLAGLLAPATAERPDARLEAQRNAFLQALGMAERGPRDGWKRIAIDLQDHPLFPYLEYASLSRHLNRARSEEVRDFLHRHGHLPVADDLRHAFARRQAERGEWRDVLEMTGESRDPARRCLWLRARIETGGDQALRADLDTLWVSPRSLPDACDPVIAHYAQRGWRTSEQVLARLRAAASIGQAGLASFLLRLLPEGERAGPERLVLAARDSQAALQAARRWPDDAFSREALTLALLAEARRDPAQAEHQLDALAARIKLAQADLGRVRHQIALFSALALEPDTARRVEAVPEAARSDDLREWAVRSAIGRQAWQEARAALQGLPPSLRQAARWRYLEARILDKLGRPQEAAALLASLVEEPSYYGFLAADRLGRAAVLCPRAAPSVDAAQEVLRRSAGLLRALELARIQRMPWARREWDRALPSLDASDRVLAARLALEQDWLDRAVFALTDEAFLDLYELRFPIGHRRLVEQRAEQLDLDPALVLAIIRAESAWMPDAGSHANAHGLMQLLPGTAAELARAEGLRYARPRDLHEPQLNIRLGTAYLQRMLARYQGSPWLAAAAYNAGPTPVARWLSRSHAGLDPDLWIETISYRETRDYVARILAFSLVYDWRLHGEAKPISARMPPRGEAVPDTVARVAVHCPVQAAVAALPADDAR
jgi:soluble lytic murein transglycosylase